MNSTIGIERTSAYFPDGVETAEQLAEKTGIPEQIIIEKFGLFKKHVAGKEMHASDLAIEAARPILTKIDPLAIDVIIYFGSPHKDYYVWSAAAKIQHELGAKNAYAFEMMNVSSCFPIALKVAKDMIIADESIENILLVGGCKESQIVDYDNPRSRFMFNFADGGAAALVTRKSRQSEILNSAIITDGSFYHDVLVPAGGSQNFPSEETVKNKQHYIDVTDPSDMKARLDDVSIKNFERVIKEAIDKSGLKMKDVQVLLPLHTKRSMFEELLKIVGLQEENAIYLDHHGHMSALDPCIGLHFAEKKGKLKRNNIVLAVSAGTGYTWAATAIKWKGW
ncbi:3-oxoacyl-ACP synthase [Pseudogracilibacillus auburnensis]|uniref:3-oxoacyl-[acyl-carrier-protein] synthase-3 n=1 Tax=Pseudogracilibacillus auburnensis TaxID=1494959 RepID=A0A2V3W8E5_9BACI|nr:3-oxoacyl-ACP synthase [Pseudogracilibacillus auburnensis]PXW90300.1 3-oxoacyl-[acyl-carrier-protein] synthase-3 [Pseudogracilibacillus auburnensis]